MVLILYQFGGFLSIDARNGYRYSSYYEKVGKTEVCIDDEIPFELPDSWAVCRCNQILSICTGKKDANYGTPTGTFPFFTCSATPIKSDTYSFDGKSLILPGNGANVGMCLYYEGKFEAYQRTYVLQPFNDNSLNIAYVKLIFDAFWREYNKEKMFGSAIPYIKLGNIERFILPIPPLHEQERIVAKIHVIDKLVEDYAKYKNAANTLNEQLPILLRKSILQYAIQGKLVPQAPSDEPASVLLERIRSEREKANGGKKSKAKTESYIFKNSDDNSYYPFDIPESWEWVQLSEICEINPAVNDTEDDYDAAFIPMKLIDDGFNNHFQYEIKKWDDVKSGYTHFQNRDVVFAKITPCFENRKSVIMENLPNGIGAGTTELHILRAYPGIAPEYLLWFVKTPYFIDYGKEHFTGTAGQQRFGTKALANMYIPIPPTNEQKRIVEKIQAMIPIIPNSLIMRK